MSTVPPSPEHGRGARSPWFPALGVLISGLMALSLTPLAPADATVVPTERVDVTASPDATQYVPCFGDGSDGPRVHAVYLREQSDEDTYTDSVPRIRSALWRLDQTFDAAARRSGGAEESRRLRFGHGEPTVAGEDQSCQAVVHEAVVPDGSRDDWGQHLDDLGVHGPDVKTVVFVDSESWEGNCFASLPGNPDHGASAWNSRRGGCWDDYVLTHELLHAFAVPHLQEYHEAADRGPDPMGGEDDSASPCFGQSASGVLPDCTGDLYFNAGTDEQHLLHEEWTHLDSGNPRTTVNVAASVFFERERPAPARHLRVRFTGSGSCLSAAEDGSVQQSACADHPDQVWNRMIMDDGYDRLIHLPTGQCLTAPARDDEEDGEDEVGPPLLSPCADGDDQRWWLSGHPVDDEGHGFRIREKSSSLGLAADSDQPEGPVSLGSWVAPVQLDFFAVDAPGTAAPEETSSPAVSEDPPAQEQGSAETETADAPADEARQPEKAGGELARTGSALVTLFVGALAVLLAGAAALWVSRRRSRSDVG